MDPESSQFEPDDEGKRRPDQCIESPADSESTRGAVDLDSLALYYLDGPPSDEVLAQVRALLSNPQFRKVLAVHSIDSANLFEFCGRMDSGTARRRPRSAGATCTGDRPNSHAPAKWKASKTVAPRAVRAAALIAIAASVVVAFFFVEDIWRNVGQGQQQSGGPVALCAIKDVVGDVHIGDAPATEFETLGAGQTVRTGGALSSVRLVFRDGTVVQLAGDTSARVHVPQDQKQVFLDYGHAAASVSPQPKGRPLLLYTPTAVLKVVGTEFAVSARPESTKLSVSEGVVLMEPRGGGEAIPVRDGEISEARLAKILPQYHAVSAPTTWGENFEAGLPAEWFHGEWVALGEGSTPGGAVATGVVPSLKQTRSADQKSMFVVQSNNEWASGLVRIGENSELKYRIKMDRPQWYQVFLCVRAAPVKDGVWSWNYEYQEASSVSWETVKPGAWREVSVPLNRFKRLDNDEPSEHYAPFELRGGEAPPPGGLVVWIMFTSQNEDRGMVIDDIQIQPAPAVSSPSGSASK